MDQSKKFFFTNLEIGTGLTVESIRKGGDEAWNKCCQKPVGDRLQSTGRENI